MDDPRPVQQLIDMARNEALLIVGVVLKLVLALSAMEGLTHLLAAAPMPQPPAALAAGATHSKALPPPTLHATRSGASATTAR